MALRIELLRALVLLSSLAVLLIMLILIGGLTIDPSNEKMESKEVIGGTPNNLNHNGQKMTEAQMLGNALFKQNCATCHNRNLIDDLTGPALAGVSDRWSAYDRKDLFRWIRNSKALVDTNHPQAVAIWKKWDKKEMTPFPNLSDADLENILAFIDG